MNLVSDMFDIVFIGHMCFDEIIPFEGETSIAPGSAVLCGALAAARVGKRIAVVTKLAQKDDAILESLRKNGVSIYAIQVAETTYMKVVHNTADVDERQIFQLSNAGFFNLSELPDINAKQIHLAGITDQEFSLEFIRGLKEKGCRLTADMQSFVRQVDPKTHLIVFNDVKSKVEIVSQLDMVKLDIVEAKMLTGTDDLVEAATIIEAWGCSEIMITKAEGALVRANGKTFFEKFSNQSVIGRTGRGDTTFAGYMARRLDHDVKDSLKFAAALVSIKMEKPGPFCGTLSDVLSRMQKYHLDE